MSEAEELLGQMVDLSIKFRPSISRPIKFGSTVAFCVFCNDEGPTPPEVKHTAGCVVYRARLFLNKGW